MIGCDSTFLYVGLALILKHQSCPDLSAAKDSLESLLSAMDSNNDGKFWA